MIDDLRRLWREAKLLEGADEDPWTVAFRAHANLPNGRFHSDWRQISSSSAADGIVIALTASRRDSWRPWSGFVELVRASVQTRACFPNGQAVITAKRHSLLGSMRRAVRDVATIATGDAAFDDAFLVRGTTPELAISLLGPEIREALLRLSSSSLTYEVGDVTVRWDALRNDASTLAVAMTIAQLAASWEHASTAFR